MWEGKSPPILIVLVYRPPDVPLRSDRHFLRLLRSTYADYSHKAIMGDWNTDMSDLGYSDFWFVLELMAELLLNIIDTEPSHHTATGDTWIDFFLTDECDSIRKHSRSPPTFPRRHRQISVQPYLKVTGLLSLTANEMDIDQGLATVTDNLQKAIDNLAPERSANHQ